jgi:hypothetical protein
MTDTLQKANDLLEQCIRDVSSSIHKIDYIFMSQSTVDLLLISQNKYLTKTKKEKYVNEICGVEVIIDQMMPAMCYRVFSKEQIERLSFKKNLGVIVV